MKGPHAQRRVNGASGEPLDVTVRIETMAKGRRYFLASPNVSPDLLLCCREEDDGDLVAVTDESEVEDVGMSILDRRLGGHKLVLTLADGTEQTVFLRFSTVLEGTQYVVVSERQELGAPMLLLRRAPASGALEIVRDPEEKKRFLALLEGLEERIDRMIVAVRPPEAIEAPSLEEGEALAKKLTEMLESFPAWAVGSPKYRELETLARNVRRGRDLLRAMLPTATPPDSSASDARGAEG